MKVFQITFDEDTDYCVRCGELFWNVELVNSYLGKLCDGCYGTVESRVRGLVRGGRRSCPIDVGKYIYFKGKNIRRHWEPYKGVHP